MTLSFSSQNILLQLLGTDCKWQLLLHSHLGEGELRQYWLVAQAGPSSDRTPPTQQGHTNTSQALLFCTSCGASLGLTYTYKITVWSSIKAVMT